jgi:hypothetical protein
MTMIVILFVLLASCATIPAAPAAHAVAADAAAFRQGVEYRIEATLDERTDVLTGRARLRYTNHAPRAIDTLYFHQHLNAFRPNSAWAQRELQFGQRRFQDLGPEEHAFERLTGVEVGGQAVRPVYPGAPDSTVVAIPLPAPLGSGQTAELRLDWQARLSTTPRRQARRGRHYDWAHWYPRIAVYDQDGWHYQQLLPQGEFWGEFASYDVTLDLAADQVIGATGVPVEGDPGWERVRAAGEIHYRRDAYPATAATPLGLLTGEPADGRRHVRWRADEVIHFAWGTDPDFVYEGGLWRDVPVHVLYQRPAADEWGNGVALRRTFGAMEFTDSIFGRYVYPQITNLHRIEPGGTEFPMLIMDGSASEGLIVHEILHQYAHAILANNEWAEGWLDEGLTSFLTNWYWEMQGRQGVWDRAMEVARERERRGMTQPIALPGAEFVDFQTYQAMTYTKASLVFRMLRELVGEETMVRILRTYYERHQLQHVSERDFRRAVNDVTGRDFGWFFDQWLHTTATLDYAVTGATAERQADGRWSTRVEVERRGEAWMPVTLQVEEERRTLDSRERRQVVTVVSRERPQVALLDPDGVLLDVDPSTHRREVVFR